MFTGITSVASNAFMANTAFVSCKLPINATMIKAGAFSGCTALSSINLDHVVDIGSTAFLNCSNLNIELNLPYLEAIGYRGFQESGITAVNNLGHITELPDGHSHYAYGVFAKCYSLETVVLPDTLIKIGLKSFYKCTKLKNMTIPANVSTICGYAFGECTSLTSVTLSASAISIEEYAFYKCKLSTVNGIEAITSIGQSCFNNCDLSNVAVLNMPKLSSVSGSYHFNYTNLERVENLGSITYAPQFQVCPKLQFVRLPSTITSIPGLFLQESSLVHTLIVEAVTPPTLQGQFSTYTESVVIYVPDVSVTAYQEATNWSSYANRIKPLSEYSE